MLAPLLSGEAEPRPRAVLLELHFGFPSPAATAEKALEALRKWGYRTAAHSGALCEARRVRWLAGSASSKVGPRSPVLFLQFCDEIC